MTRRISTTERKVGSHLALGPPVRHWQLGRGESAPGSARSLAKGPSILQRMEATRYRPHLPSGCLLYCYPHFIEEKLSPRKSNWAKLTQPAKHLRPCAWMNTLKPELLTTTQSPFLMRIWRAVKHLQWLACCKCAKGIWHSWVKKEAELEGFWWVSQGTETNNGELRASSSPVELWKFSSSFLDHHISSVRRGSLSHSSVVLEFFSCLVPSHIILCSCLRLANTRTMITNRVLKHKTLIYHVLQFLVYQSSSNCDKVPFGMGMVSLLIFKSDSPLLCLSALYPSNPSITWVSKFSSLM